MYVKLRLVICKTHWYHEKDLRENLEIHVGETEGTLCVVMLMELVLLVLLPYVKSSGS